MHRFFFEETLRENDLVTLSEEEARHAQVLRLKKECSIVLLDGLGGVFAADIEAMGKGGVTARITGELPDCEASTRVTLYQGIPKGDKMEGILQKCTELGVHAIQPVLFDRCVKEPTKSGDKWLARLRRIAREAAKQCGRGQVPMVGQPKPLKELMGRIHDHGLILLPWEEATGTYIREAMGANPPREIALIIGPEGGITPEEVALLSGLGAKPVTLGPRILRTETAGMAALSAILTLTGDL